MTTSQVLVAIFSWEKPYFDDEPGSRRHFVVGNSIFWRRNQISSPF
ncbi:hypothetical protein QPM05_04650 [Caldibacillus thermoamylovorans]|nr:hypothetical protein [Caldibacillus thermoamylovorans]